MDIHKILKQNKKRVTPERIDIFHFLETKHIFTYNDISHHFENIGRASIFRTLNLFLDLGVIRKVELGEKTMSYEVNDPDHHHEHMKCNECHAIIDFHSHEICNKIFAEASKIGFQIKSHNIGILGVCKNCL